MSRPRRIDKNLVTEAKRLVAATKDADELRAAQAVLLSAMSGTTLEQTAMLLGVSRATVPRLQGRFRRKLLTQQPIYEGWGGRRRVLMSLDEEKAFLKPWIQQAKEGGILVASPIRAALAQKLGRKVVATVAYRMLARHGWRKIVPDTRHPKSDPVVQQDWKKNFRKHWRSC